jgi:hypothetical protein
MTSEIIKCPRCGRENEFNIGSDGELDGLARGCNCNQSHFAKIRFAASLIGTNLDYTEAMRIFEKIYANDKKDYLPIVKTIMGKYERNN